MNFDRFALFVAILAATPLLSGCRSSEPSETVVEFVQYADGNWVVLDERTGRPDEGYYSYAKVTCEPSGQARIEMDLTSESMDWSISDVYRSHGRPYLAREIRIAGSRQSSLAQKADRGAPIVVTRRDERLTWYDFLVSLPVFDDAHPFPFALPACARDAFAAGGRERP